MKIVYTSRDAGDLRLLVREEPVHGRRMLEREAQEYSKPYKGELFMHYRHQ